jgi:hypothetical protein
MDGRMETLKPVQMIQDKGKSFLRKIITIDESAVCMLMPNMKMQLKQWLKKGDYNTSSEP